MTQVSKQEAARIARTNMVESQLRPNRVYNAEVMAAMLELPREAFVPAELRGVAYTDISLKVAPGRYLMEPLVLARMLDGLEVRRGHSLLVIGAGTGYSAALAARIGANVTALEEDAALYAALQANMAALDLGCVTLCKGALASGTGGSHVFHHILVDGGAGQVPQAVLEQLKEGGRLVCVLGEPGGASHITVFERTGDIFSRRMTFDNAAPVLPGFERVREFVL